MKNLKRNDPGNPVWCAQCYVRIAPYERAAVRKGKTYHQGCYSKATGRTKNSAQGRQ